MDRPKRIAWPLGRDLLAAPVPPLEPVGDAQRRERERHERRHPVPHREPERALRPDLGDRADEHAARPGDRVLHLAAGRDDVEHLGADRVPVAVVLLGQLAEGRRVEVERLDVDPHLVRPDLRPRVEAGSPPAAARPGVPGRGAARGATGRGSTQILLSQSVSDRRISGLLVVSRGRSPCYPSIMTAAMTLPDQPYAYRRRELVEPDWTRLPGWAHVTPAEWADAQWQRAHCVKNVRQLRAVMGDLLTADFYADLERDQAERATMSMLAPAADAEHHGAVGRRGRAGGRRRVHRGLLRRPGPALHAPRLLRPPHRLAVPPPRDARQPPRARHVGRRGPDPPLPHQGARRDAADLPAVLRPLHPDGPRRQLHAAVRQAQARRQAGRPVRRDARLPLHDAPGPRRRRLRRRRGQHAVEEPRGLPRPAARGRQHPRHPAGHQGAHGPAAALAGGRRRRGRRRGSRPRRARAACRWPSTPTSTPRSR